MGCRRSSPDGRALLKARVLEIGQYIVRAALVEVALRRCKCYVSALCFALASILLCTANFAEERNQSLFFLFQQAHPHPGVTSACAEHAQGQRNYIAVFATTTARLSRMHQAHLHSAHTMAGCTGSACISQQRSLHYAKPPQCSTCQRRVKVAAAYQNSNGPASEYRPTSRATRIATAPEPQFNTTSAAGLSAVVQLIAKYLATSAERCID